MLCFFSEIPFVNLRRGIRAGWRRNVLMWLKRLTLERKIVKNPSVNLSFTWLSGINVLCGWTHVPFPSETSSVHLIDTNQPVFSSKDEKLLSLNFHHTSAGTTELSSINSSPAEFMSKSLRSCQFCHDSSFIWSINLQNGRSAVYIWLCYWWEMPKLSDVGLFSMPLLVIDW